jgi:hypothetical protein
MRAVRASLVVLAMVGLLVPGRASGSPPTAAQIAAAIGDAGSTILNVSPMALPETGVEAYAIKTLTASGSVKALALAGDATVLSHDRLVADENAAGFARFGKLFPRLFYRLQEAGPSSALPVKIWTKAEVQYPAKDRLLKDPAALAAHRADSQVRLASAVEPVLSWLAAHSAAATGMSSSADILSPMVSSTVASGAISELAAVDSVAWIDLDVPGKPASTAWYSNTSVASARSISTGYGITGCIVESDRPVDSTYLNVSGTASLGGCTDYHAQVVAGIIANTYSGNATSVTNGSVYFANWDQFSFNSTYPTMWAWCNAQSAHVDNYSWYTESGTDPNFGAIDAQIDWYTKNYPYPLIVTSSGNDGGYSQNKNRNGLVIGASDDKGTSSTSDDTIASISSWQNPSTLHSDLELPALVAPGVAVDSANLSNYTGTSFATAQVTGAAMLMLSRDGNLAGWPEESRAVLMATAVANVDGAVFSHLPTSDMKDGAGRLNTYNAVLLADPANSVGTNNIARANGRSHINMSLANDFTSSIYNGTWTIQAASSGNIRVIATWDATPSCSGIGGTNCTESLDADLDLLVYSSTGVLICSSTAFDSSWEGCDFSSTAGATYTVKISQASRNRDETYFALAWFSH